MSLASVEVSEGGVGSGVTTRSVWSTSAAFVSLESDSGLPYHRAAPTVHSHPDDNVLYHSQR
jgi:hypothetical protein